MSCCYNVCDLTLCPKQYAHAHLYVVQYALVLVVYVVQDAVHSLANAVLYVLVLAVNAAKYVFHILANVVINVFAILANAV